MIEKKFEFVYQVYATGNELPEPQKRLLALARKGTANAYAPYSGFRVGAVAELADGTIIEGTNQENASFPAGICAERVLLSAVSSFYPSKPIQRIAISYNSESARTDRPISPCGICRQSLQEYQSRIGSPIELILGGHSGPVYVISNAASLLPLAFSSDDLG